MGDERAPVAVADRLRAGIGASEVADAREAGADAARAACAALDGRRPDLVLVFASVRYDLAAVLAGVNAVTGGARSPARAAAATCTRAPSPRPTRGSPCWHSRATGTGSAWRR
ncbi:hypothetical protein ACFQX7_34590 [Luedemannella flava]